MLSRNKRFGLANAKNYGLQYVDTEYVAYLDVDDSMFPQRLEMQLSYLEGNPFTDFCFTQAWDRDKHGRLLLNCFALGDYVTHEQIQARILHENVLMHGSFMGRMESLRDIGFYNESEQFRGKEDWELWVRAMAQGKKFHKINERLCIYSLNCSVLR